MFCFCRFCVYYLEVTPLPALTISLSCALAISGSHCLRAFGIPPASQHVNNHITSAAMFANQRVPVSHRQSAVWTKGPAGRGCGPLITIKILGQRLRKRSTAFLINAVRSMKLSLVHTVKCAQGLSTSGSRGWLVCQEHQPRTSCPCDHKCRSPLVPDGNSKLR